MKKYDSTLFASLFSIILAVNLLSCSKSLNNKIYSPDQNLVVQISQDNQGSVFYSAKLNGVPVIDKSKLGIIREDSDFTKGLSLIKTSAVESISKPITLLHGKTNEAIYTANRKIFHFANADSQKIDIIFQVSDNGLAFRYRFPEQSDEVYRISEEFSCFNFDETTLAWIQPIAKARSGWESTNPSYEENYLSEILIDSIPVHEPGWIFPALFKRSNFWIHITESAPDRDYCASRLQPVYGSSEMKIAFPEAIEHFQNGSVYPQSNLPWETPWRILTMSESLGDIIESTQTYAFAKPSRVEDISWIKPGRSSWSWVLFKDDSTVFNVQKRFIDYASDMGWKYCLVDADWDQKIGYEKLGELCKYAEKKDVGILTWYNSAGDWNTSPYTPRDKILTKESREKEFSILNNLGVKGVKVDFFGGDGQSVMTYYEDIFEDAARHKLMVNCHGTTLPRGWNITYPNLLTMESIKGFEFVTFVQENADNQPKHCTIIPFTRNVFDPMDFTPVCFSEVPNIERKTSNTFELALSVLFLSGIQHYAEVPEGMAKVLAKVKQFMKEVPVSWDETRFIDGYPGEYVIIARRSGNNWYVAGINGTEKNKDLKIDLTFLQNASKATFFTDGDDKRSFKISEDTLDFGEKMGIALPSKGGFVIKASV